MKKTTSKQVGTRLTEEQYNFINSTFPDLTTSKAINQIVEDRMMDDLFKKNHSDIKDYVHKTVKELSEDKNINRLMKLVEKVSVETTATNALLQYFIIDITNMTDVEEYNKLYNEILDNAKTTVSDNKLEKLINDTIQKSIQESLKKLNK